MGVACCGSGTQNRSLHDRAPGVTGSAWDGYKPQQAGDLALQYPPKSRVAVAGFRVFQWMECVNPCTATHTLTHVLLPTSGEELVDRKLLLGREDGGIRGRGVHKVPNFYMFPLTRLQCTVVHCVCVM